MSDLLQSPEIKSPIDALHTVKVHYAKEAVLAAANGNKLEFQAHAKAASATFEQVDLGANGLDGEIRKLLSREKVPIDDFNEVKRLLDSLKLLAQSKNKEETVTLPPAQHIFEQDTQTHFLKAGGMRFIEAGTVIEQTAQIIREGKSSKGILRLQQNFTYDRPEAIKELQCLDNTMLDIVSALSVQPDLCLVTNDKDFPLLYSQSGRTSVDKFGRKHTVGGFAIGARAKSSKQEKGAGYNNNKPDRVIVFGGEDAIGVEKFKTGPVFNVVVNADGVSTSPGSEVTARNMVAKSLNEFSTQELPPKIIGNQGRYQFGVLLVQSIENANKSTLESAQKNEKEFADSTVSVNALALSENEDGKEDLYLFTATAGDSPVNLYLKRKSTEKWEQFPLTIDDDLVTANLVRQRIDFSRMTPGDIQRTRDEFYQAKIAEIENGQAGMSHDQAAQAAALDIDLDSLTGQHQTKINKYEKGWAAMAHNDAVREAERRYGPGVYVLNGAGGNLRINLRRYNLSRDLPWNDIAELATLSCSDELGEKVSKSEVSRCFEQGAGTAERAGLLAALAKNHDGDDASFALNSIYKN